MPWGFGRHGGWVLGKSTSVSIEYVSAPIAVFAVPRTVSVHKLRVALDDTDSKPNSDSKVSAPGCSLCWTKGKRCLLGFTTGVWGGYVRCAVLVFDTRIGWADCYRRMPLQWILIRSRNVWMNTYPNDAGQSPTFWRQRRIMSLCAPFTVKTGSFVTSWKRAFPLSSIIKSQWVSVVGTYNSTEISGRWQLAVGPIFQATQSSEEVWLCGGMNWEI